MSITTFDQLVNAVVNKQQQIMINKVVGTVRAGQLTSLWTRAGLPGIGATPTAGSGQIYDATIPGAMAWGGNPTGTDRSYVYKYVYVGNGNTMQNGIIDRFVATSGLSGNTAAAQTVNTVALPSRVSDPHSVECWLEIYVATGSTLAANAVVTYTNSNGVSGRVSPSFFFSNVTIPTIVGSFIPVPLQNGDLGVQSVQSVQLSAATGTAGNFGVTLGRRVVGGLITSAGLAMPSLGPFSGGLPYIDNDPCLMQTLTCSAIATGINVGNLTVVQG